MSAEIYKKVKLAIEKPGDLPLIAHLQVQQTKKKICICIFQKCWKQLNWISTYNKNTTYSTAESLALWSSNYNFYCSEPPCYFGPFWVWETFCYFKNILYTTTILCP